MPEIHIYMARQIQSIAADATVQQAAKKMLKLKIGSLLVVRGKQHVGIVTRTDMTTKVVAAGVDTNFHRVESIMSTPIIFIDAHAPLQEADRVMNVKRIRHLVVQERGQVVGIISVRDLILYFAHGKVEFTEKRGYFRLPFTAVVKYQDDQKQEYSAVTYDINGGGLFIQTAAPLSAGSPISVELTLPKGGKTIRSTGIVAWLRNTPKEVMKAAAKIIYVRENHQQVIRHPGGMGIKFTNISEESRVTIMEFIAEITDMVSASPNKGKPPQED